MDMTGAISERVTGTIPETVLCLRCMDRGIVVNEETRSAHRCGEWEGEGPCLKMEPRYFDAAGIPKKLQGKTAAGYRPQGDQQRAARAAVVELVQNRNPERGLTFCGPCGAGKSHLVAVAMMERRRRYGCKLLWVSMDTVLKQILKSYGYAETRTRAEILRPILTADIVNLDDLGVYLPKDTEHTFSLMFEIINGRDEAGLLTMATTNYAWHQAPDENSSPALKDRIGDRSASRLAGMTNVLMLGGDDYRPRREP